MKKNVGPRIEESALKFYADNFQSPNFEATYILEAFPILYDRALREVRGMFSQGELLLILDVFNGTMLTQQLAGQHILASVADGIDLDRLDKKWEIEADAFLTKIRALTSFQRTCLEIWAVSYWYGGIEGNTALKEVGSFEAWIAPLLAE